MARRYVNALENKIQRVKAGIETGGASQEDREWLRKVEEMRQPKPKRTINLNPGLEQPKRRKTNQYPAVSPVQRYRHPPTRPSV